MLKRAGDVFETRDRFTASADQNLVSPPSLKGLVIDSATQCSANLTSRIKPS